MSGKNNSVIDIKGRAEVVTIFAAVSNTDTIEGRGSSIDISYHLTEAEALEAGRGKGVHSADAKAEPRAAVLFETGEYLLLAFNGITTADSLPLITLNVVGEEQKHAIRLRALKKLTMAERIALGIEGC